MTPEKVYFNGINGVTGSYGLPPMTAEALVRQIEGSGRLPGKRGALKRMGRQNAQALAELVKLLAGSSVDPGERDEDWHRNWVEVLAHELSRLLLEDEYQAPEKLRELEQRLARHTVHKIERIAQLLANGSENELVELLLEDPDEEPDNRGILSAQLQKDTQEWLREAQRMLEEEIRAVNGAGKSASKISWLESWMLELRLIPIDSMRVTTRGRVEFSEPLVQRLDELAGSLDVPDVGLDALRQGLAGLPPDAGWNDLVDVLHKGLPALVKEAEPQVGWADLLAAMLGWLRAIYIPGVRRDVIEGVDRTNLGQAGWGIIFPYEDPQVKPRVPAIKGALQPLLALRQSQAGSYFKVYEGADGYRPNDTASKFVARHDARVADPVDPKRMPYYLLIVGSPEEIPFHFQYQLDVQYAVGRIDFGDDPEAYANYARNVVAAESGGLARPLRASFFGVSNPNDRATQLSADHLVEPLYERIQARYGERWQVEAVLREEATKARLMQMVGGEGTPSLLFAASHGMEYPKDDGEGRQERYQGALLCQDWDGPEGERGEVSRDYYLSGEDLGRDADLGGMIAFFFACYGAGTPRFDEYTKQAFIEEQVTIADRPFVAALPKAMLGLGRGALAVVGHVERAWGTSFLGGRPGARQSEQIAVFESAMERLLEGQPLGAAMEYFDGRYAALSTELTAELENAQWREPDPYDLAEMWTANNDARGYIVLGDPAVRLPVAPEAETKG